MFDIFGSEMPLPAKFFIAFAAVLALIALTAWLVRRFASDRLGGGSSRGRQPRLAVIDAATVDGRRRLVLIRRDNVEHLMMIGGPTDVVVEQNIVRAAPAAPRAPDAPSRPGEPALRQQPTIDTGFPLQPVTETAPLPPPRPYRAPATEEPWHAPEPGARPRPASSEHSLTGLAAELSGRLTPPEPAPPVAPVTPPVTRHEAPRMAAPPVASPAAPQAEFEPGSAPQTDHNLAEMAQQLEAALRRAPAVEGRAPVTDPLAAQPAMPIPPKPVEVPRRDYKLRVDPRVEGALPDRAEPKVEPKVEPKIEPKLDAKFEPRIEPTLAPARPDMPRANPTAKSAPAGKSVYDSLEEEMASLLGRPPGKT